MSVIKSVLSVVLGFAIGAGCFFVGRHSVKHALVYDQASKTWVPLSLKKDTKIAVASPLGLEPGVAYKIVNDPDEGTAVVILPPSLIPDDQPDQSTKPDPQKQSDHGQIDRTTLLAARQ